MDKNIVVSNIKGGFGNQLFQYSTCLAVALKNKSKIKLDLSFYDNNKYKNVFKLNLLNIDFEIAQQDEILDLKNSEERIKFFYKLLNKIGLRNKFNKTTHITDSFGFKPSRKILNAKSPVYIEGWCVKEIYFREIREILKKIFTLKNPISEHAQEFLQEILKTNSVSLHIRRGDYINNEFFKVLSLNYYNECINEIIKLVENPVFFIFSDDLEWCRLNLNIKKPFNFVDLKSKTSYSGLLDMEDFFLMKNCKHNIIANSSYSWWAAYLNANVSAIIVSPKVWYNDKLYQSSLDKYSFIPTSWIKI